MCQKLFVLPKKLSVPPVPSKKCAKNSPFCKKNVPKILHSAEKMCQKTINSVDVEHEILKEQGAGEGEPERSYETDL